MPRFHDRSLSKSRGKSSRQISRSTPTTVSEMKQTEMAVNRTNEPYVLTPRVSLPSWKKKKNHSDRPAENSKRWRGEDLSLKKSERLRRENDSLHLLCKFYSLENDNFRGVNNCASFIRSIDRSNDTYPRSPWRREKRGEKGGAREDQ